MKSLLPGIAFLVLLTLTPPVHADTNADNSGNNVVDRQADSATAESQSNASEDVKVTAAIRRAIVKESSLSMYAHNIKIITTADHVVYLRGPVASMSEKKMVLKLAKKNSGGYPVKNEISISS